MNRNRIISLCCAAGLAFVSGCVHVDLNVALHDNDAGATITERLRVTRTLEQLCSKEEDRAFLKTYLDRKAAAERTGRMGIGVTLVSHEMRDIEGGGLESVAVYRIPNANDLRLSNPFVRGAPATVHRLSVWVDTRKTIGDSKRRNEGYGIAGLGFREVEKTRLPVGVVKKTTTPLDRHAYRELRPVIEDLLSDLYIAVRVEVPTKFVGGHVRGIRAGPRKATVFSVSGKNLDARGQGFFENEEVMIRLLEMDLDSSVIRQHTAFMNSGGTPVYRTDRGDDAFRFRPTSHMIRKHFGGKDPRGL